MRSQILFISGRNEDARRLSRMLQPLPVVLDHAQSLQQARAKLQQDDYDVVLTEAALPDGRWLDVLHLVREQPKELDVIVTDPQADAHFWAEALNLGAHDVLAKPFDAAEVVRTLSYAWLQWANRNELALTPAARAGGLRRAAAAGGLAARTP